MSVVEIPEDCTGISIILGDRTELFGIDIVIEALKSFDTQSYMEHKLILHKMDVIKRTLKKQVPSPAGTEAQRHLKAVIDYLGAA